MSDRNFNGGWGGDYDVALPWDEFDAMPWPIRELFCLAAYNYTPLAAFELLLQGKPTGYIVREIRGRLKAALRREVLRLYGPEHPQAQ